MSIGLYLLRITVLAINVYTYFLWQRTVLDIRDVLRVSGNRLQHVFTRISTYEYFIP